MRDVLDGAFSKIKIVGMGQVFGLETSDIIDTMKARGALSPEIVELLNAADAGVIASRDS